MTEEWDSNEGSQGEAKAKRLWKEANHPKQTKIVEVS